MSLAAATAAGEDPAADAAEIRLPADIDWEMLDKSRFFVLGAALFSGVSAALYPVVVLKTRLQVSPTPLSSLRTASSIFRLEGPRGFYRGFGTSLTGTVPARALYMAALEVTKSTVGGATVRFGVPEPAAAAVANAAAGVSAAVAAQVVWTPIDVVSQRLMVQGSGGGGATRYRNGIDAFRKILMADGLRGLYRGFGMSILTYAPSNAVWWASYSLSQRTIWGGIGYYLCRNGGCDTSNGNNTSGDSNGASERSNNSASNVALTPGCKAVVAVQAASAAVAGGMAALVTMPLDTIKTRMQVLDGEEGGGGGKKAPMTVARTVRSLLREGGWAACYRGLGPRWASMSMSATTMITTYEFLKRLSAKSGAQDGLA
ncbi:hypothetical protein Taro_034861 [Colocasia esculenta]|uniref:Mitochondrial carrier protein n=1 Tax=Colocasia esculenta TaxID=4460 RepID=A0A843VYV6_COLES|nr:hypothetical protein [Colocasia esculenta]